MKIGPFGRACARGARLAAMTAFVTTVAGFAPATAHSPTVGAEPSTLSTALDPGGATTVNKVVHTATVPPKPDVVFLADTTASMGSAIANVKANVLNVISGIRSSQPQAQFGAAEYKDREHGCPSDPYDFKLNQPLTASDPAVQAGVNTWTASGGCDIPENQLLALHRIATDPAVGFRGDSTRIVAWFGDAPAHDDGNPSLAQTIAALEAAKIRVVAVSVGANQLDATGQASAITNATGGVLLHSGADVAAAILAGISAIQVTVTPSVRACDSNLSVAFSPNTRAVTSGDDATFAETISVAAAAPQGSTLSCQVDFLIDGNPVGPEFTQEISIRVNDVTPPTATCEATTNPSGNKVPTAGTNPKSGQNPDGFYELRATDNVDPDPQLFLVDTGSGTVFGPFASGTRIKYTQASGVTPTQEPMGKPSDAVQWHIKGTGDASLFAVDASGNDSRRAACLVPAPPK